jgi:hypothetical protein
MENTKKVKGLPKGHTKALKEYYFIYNEEIFPTIASFARVMEKLPYGIYTRITKLGLENILKHNGIFIYNNNYIQIKKSGTPAPTN